MAGRPGAMTAAHVEDTLPYPWPYDGRLVATTLALVLAGWDAGWWARAESAGPSLGRCQQLAAAVAGFGGLVVTVHHGVDPPDTSVPPELGDLAGGRLGVPAAGIDGFHGGPLDASLRRAGRTHLVLAGIGLEGPVHSTLRSANDRGYECLLVTDACASLDAGLAGPAAHTVTMSGGIFGAIGETAAVLRALDPDR